MVFALKSKKYLLIIFIVMFLLDFGFTLYSFHVEGHSYREANILYLLTGSMWLPVLMNLIVIGAFIWVYRSTAKPFLNYLWISIMLYVSAARVPAIINAIKSIKNPMPVEIAAQIPVATKMSFYITFELIVIYLPILIVCLVYYFFRMDYKFKLKCQDTKK